MVCEPDHHKDCSSGCCGGQRKEIKFGDAWVPQVPSKGNTESGRSTQKPQEADPNKPICCKDKPSPCCDDTCLDRIALRECDKGQILSLNDASRSMFKERSETPPDPLTPIRRPFELQLPRSRRQTMRQTPSFRARRIRSQARSSGLHLPRFDSSWARILLLTTETLSTW